MLSQEMIDKLMEVNEEERCILEGQQGINRDLYMEGDTNVINSRKLMREGRLITIRKHTRFVHFPKHRHDYIEVIYMVQGHTTHYVNGELVELRQGEILFMSQNATQEILHAGREDLGVNFIILPEFFDTTIAMMGGGDTPLHRLLIECLKGEYSEESYLHYRVADVLPVQNLLENLIWELVSEPHGRQAINQNTMGLLIMHLMDHTETMYHSSPERKMRIEVLNYVEEHYREGSLEELARLLHYDTSVLSREIKKRFKCNYTDLIQQKRMAQAVTLLKNTDLSIAEIAYNVGYENTSYFYRIFRGAFGVAPRAYRVAYRKSIAQAVAIQESGAGIQFQFV